MAAVSKDEGPGTPWFETPRLRAAPHHEVTNIGEHTMSSFLLTAPAAEPLSLDEAKAHLRVESSDEDDLIAALVTGARLHVEAQTRRALISQSWRVTADAWPPDGRLTVTPAPLQSLTAVRVYDEEGTARDVDLQTFVLDLANSALVFAPWALPAPGRCALGIEIDVVAGYSATANDVPEPLRQAIRLLIAHWYENRGLAAAGQSLLPETVAALLAPYRVLSL
jgi:uncharacterized phiE125 gp8 family phage protein